MPKRWNTDFAASSGTLATTDSLLIEQGGTVYEIAPDVLATGQYLLNPPYPAGKTLWVDSVNGVDATGLRQRADKPFLTLAAAQTAASSGDTIIVGPGSYAITAALGKNGVNWHLMPGVTLTATSANGAAAYVFTDGGAAMTFRVSGRGALVVAGVNSGDINEVSACVNVRHASSDIRVEAAALSCTCTIGENEDVPSAVYQDAGVLHVSADTITVSGGAGYAVWWTNGEMHVSGRKIVSNGSSTVYVDVNALPTGDCHIHAHQITNTVVSGTAISAYASHADAKLWITVDVVASAGIGIIAGGGKTYLTVQKLSGWTATSSDTSGVVHVTDGTLWLACMKLTGTYESGIYFTSVTGALFATVAQIEDLGNMTRAVRNAGSGTAVLELSGTRFVSVTGDGVLHASGTTRLMGCRFNTVAAGSTKAPVRLSGAGCIVDHCTLVAHGSGVSVDAAAAQTIKSYGSYTNKAVDGDVTVQGTLTVDANVG